MVGPTRGSRPAAGRISSSSCVEQRRAARRHRFDAQDKAALEVWFLSEEFKRLTKLMFGIDAAIAAVGLGSLISGMVGISNILFVSVRERTREFGIRRALGATARSILGMVIAEALENRCPHVLETQGWALRLFGLEP